MNNEMAVNVIVSKYKELLNSADYCLLLVSTTSSQTKIEYSHSIGNITRS